MSLRTMWSDWVRTHICTDITNFPHMSENYPAPVNYIVDQTSNHADYVLNELNDLVSRRKWMGLSNNDFLRLYLIAHDFPAKENTDIEGMTHVAALLEDRLQLPADKKEIVDGILAKAPLRNVSVSVAAAAANTNLAPMSLAYN